MASRPLIAKLSRYIVGGGCTELSKFSRAASCSALAATTMTTPQHLWQQMQNEKAGNSTGHSQQPADSCSSEDCCWGERSCAPASTSGARADMELRMPFKSAKRKAAEALLAARYASPLATTASATAVQNSMNTLSGKRACTTSTNGSDTQRSAVCINACPRSCTCSEDSTGWCHFEVKMPHTNWQAVFEEPPSTYTSFQIARGYERVYLPEGLVAYVVESPRHVEDALAKLKASMEDAVVAIDLEWKPELAAGQPASPVALMQLSSATVCVLIRTSTMGYTLPSAVRSFLTDPRVVLVGFGWEQSDEAKMTRTFSIGKSMFKNFFDLQAIAHALGYHRFGLARLTKQVLGFSLQKSKAVSRSNWAARTLSPHQVKYAALDVFAAGQLFRGLRAWHASPSPCQACRQPMGAVLAAFSRLTCSDPSGCGQTFGDWNSYYSHCQERHHAVVYSPCPACGRVARSGTGTRAPSPPVAPASTNAAPAPAATAAAAPTPSPPAASPSPSPSLSPSPSATSLSARGASGSTSLSPPPSTSPSPSPSPSASQSQSPSQSLAHSRSPSASPAPSASAAPSQQHPHPHPHQGGGGASASSSPPSPAVAQVQLRDSKPASLQRPRGSLQQPQPQQRQKQPAAVPSNDKKGNK